MIEVSNFVQFHHVAAPFYLIGALVSLLTFGVVVIYFAEQRRSLMGDMKDILITLIVATAVVFSASFLSQCEQKNIDITCNTDQESCLDYLERVAR